MVHNFEGLGVERAYKAYREELKKIETKKNRDMEGNPYTVIHLLHFIPDDS